MSIATRFPKSQAVAGFDIKDPSLVLYLPLWFPYSDMAGSTIYSYDTNRRTGTVAGATWGRLGRTFDGVDDSLSIPSAAGIDNKWDGGGTWISWINPRSDGEGSIGRIFQVAGGWDYLWVSGEAAGKVNLQFEIAFSLNTPSWTTTATEVFINTWAMVSLLYDADAAANNPTIYVDARALTVGGGLTESVSPSGSRSDSSGNNLLIGTNAAPGTATFDGTIGDVLFYNRVLTAGEVARLYQATKGRYQ